MKNRELLEGLSKEAASIVDDFVESGGLDYPDDANTTLNPRGLLLSPDMKQLAGNLAQAAIWETEEQLCLAFLFKLEDRRKMYFFLGELLGRQEDVLSIAGELERPPTAADLAKSIPSLGISYFYRENPSPERPFTAPFGNIHWDHIDWSKTLYSKGDFLKAIARWRTDELMDMFSKNDKELLAFIMDGRMHDVVQETERLDELFVNRAVQHFATPIPNQDSSSRRDYNQRVFFQIKKLSDLRENRYHDILSDFAVMPELVLKVHAIDVLLHQRPDIVLEAVSAELDSNMLCDHNEYNRGDRTMDRLLRLAINQVDGKGAPLIRKVFARYGYGCASRLIQMLLDNPNPLHRTVIRELLLESAAALKNSARLYFWEELARHDKGLLLPEWQAFAKGKSKPMREIATKWLLKHEAENAMSDLDELLASNAVADRLAGVSLLASSASAKDLERLQSIHQSEPTKQVRVTIAAVLSKHGMEVPSEPEKQVEEVQDIGSFESSLLKRAKTIRLPKAPWLDFDALPPLKTADGRELSKLATTYIFQCQARARPGVVVPEVEVLLAYLSRGGNPDFARLLLEQWFASDMKAPGRWALVIVGITGDDSLIERLVEPIPAWCKANLGARAEWVIHCLSLLASEKAMAALDELAQKFRTQRAYVGKAAAIAMESIAANLGISKNELSERLVSTCGFDSEGSREFESVGGGSITGQLDLDFKISWKDPRSGQLVKNPPALPTPQADAELKDIRKTIKQAVSLQTARLQDAMISERRWDITTWRNRFENHPLFRIIAMRLIWATFDDAGTLLNTFRLYPNGLTASADGALEEFPPPAKTIGIVHSLMLDEEAKRNWAAHLARFKIKPFFKQLDRPAHTLDPLHRNRKELRITDGVKATAGKLRSQLFARGWSLEAAGDGGWIGALLRKFPDCGITVQLLVEDLHAGSSKDDEIMLGKAFFTRDPANPSDDAEAFPFDQVPPIIYSETLADLEAVKESKA
jgi:hypothetical protein